MIEASQRMINEENNLIVNERYKLQIKTLQNAPRDAEISYKDFESERKTKGGGNIHRGHTKASDGD
jgi:hypothetical protein